MFFVRRENHVISTAGFQIEFENGLGVSVQFGETNYCDNQFKGLGETDRAECANAEVAVFARNYGFVDGWPHKEESDQVRGWLNSEQVLDVLLWAKLQNPKQIKAATL